MRSASWVQTPVFTPTAAVLLNGSPVDVDAVSVSREIPRPMPAQTSGVGGVGAATGEVSWSQREDVTDRVPTPWTDQNRPATGDRVEVLAGRDGQNHRVFTGMVDDAPGQFSEPGFSSGIVDDIDRLNRAVSWDALALVMPPWDSNSTTSFKRMTGLTGVYVTDKCLRAGGFNATPPRDPNCVVWAPLMGSTWPELGSLLDSCRVQDIGNGNRLSPRWTSSRWGVSTADAYAEYLPWLGTMDGKITAGTPLNITLMSGVSENLAASGYVMAVMADGNIIRLGVTSSRSLVGQIVTADQTTTTVVSLTEGQAGGEWSTATLRVYPSGSSWAWEIQTDLTPLTGGTATAASTAVSNDPLHRVRVYAPEGSFLGGAQVSFSPTTRSAACLYTRTARVSVGKIWYLDAIPAMSSTTAKEILEAQAEAEWAGLWIDEDGVAQWRDVDRMLTSTSVAELTTDNDDLLDVQFRFDSQDVRHKTVVSYVSMPVSLSRKYRLIGYEGPKDELEPGDSQDLWIEPEAGTHWIEPDVDPHRVFGDYGATTINSGQGTLMGFTGLNIDGDEIAVMNGDSPLAVWDLTMEKVGPKIHYTCTVTSLPGTADRVKTSTRSDDAGSVAKAYRDRGLPLVRCRGIVKESPQEYVSTITGPDWAADYEHPGSWFVQHTDQAKDIGDRIANQLSTPRPVVESVSIIPDSRLQLGDKVTVTDSARTGVRLVGVIAGISQDVAAGRVPTMSLKLIVTEVSTPHVTLAEFDAWYDGMTLAQLDTLFAGSTLSDMDANPLR